MRKYLVPILVGLVAAAGYTVVDAQLSNQPTTTVVVAANPYPLVPISNTAAVNTQVTLTIPAPPAGMYNYICSLHAEASTDGTGTTTFQNAVTTSTNFNSFALKVSTGAAKTDTQVTENWGIANVGCVKSTSPGTATTFVSPAGVANAAWSWDATYFQAP